MFVRYVNWAARNISILKTWWWSAGMWSILFLFFGSRNGLTFANKQTTRFHFVSLARNQYNFASNYYSFILRMYIMRSQAHSPLSSNARLLNEANATATAREKLIKVNLLSCCADQRIILLVVAILCCFWYCKNLKLSKMNHSAVLRESNNLTSYVSDFYSNWERIN